MARAYILFTLCFITPLVTPQCTLQRAEPSFRRSIYEFSVELLRRIAEDTEGHFVSSTISPWTLLSAVSLGAADETLAEIKRVLHHHSHKCFNNKYLELAKQVASTDESATLERSSVLFVDNTLGLKSAFQKKLTDTGICEISPISFEDFTFAAALINEYVKSTTHGIIEEIITPSDLEGVYVIMVDALYFKGTWKKAFSVENTQTSAFYDTHKNLIGDVQMMFINSQFNSTKIDPIEATALELPYGNSGRFSMLIILPNEGVSLLNVIGNLKKISLGSIFGLFKRQGPRSILVRLPRFKITSDIDNMKELLIDMGLREMFDPGLAKFPLLSDYQLHVSSFIQKADIEVTETGTVAAAVTELGFSFRSYIEPEEFTANRPFLFLVVDRQTEVPVFSGAYSKPSLY